METIICSVMFLLNFIITWYFGKRSKTKRRSNSTTYKTIFSPAFTSLASLLISVLLVINVALTPWNPGSDLSFVAKILIGTFGVLTNVFLFWTLSVLGENFHPLSLAIVPTHIERTGPYRFLKHPIYTCNSIQFGVMVILIPSAMSVALLSAIVFLYVVAIKDEERCNESIKEISK